MNIVYMRRGEYEGMVEFKTTRPGEYTFTFSNLGDSHYNKVVNFLLHTNEEPVEVPQFDYLFKEEVQQDDGAKVATDVDLRSVAENLKKTVKNSN